jgi:glycosyltransferase involved in cell wall biosynthesis
MKIALIHYTAPPVVGGVESSLARQAAQLSQAGHLVSVLAGRGETWNARYPVRVVPRIDPRHPDVLNVRAELEDGSLPQEFRPLVQQVESDLREALVGCEVVIAHNIASLHRNLALTAALYNISQSPRAPRMILWHHDLAWAMPRFQDELYPGWPWDLLRTPWGGVRQVVTSQARREQLVGLFGIPEEEIAVIPTGLDLPGFLGLQSRSARLVQDLKLMDSAPILLTPVRISRRKNLEMALQVAAALRREMPLAALVVTGPPASNHPASQDYFQSLLKLRDELDLRGCAHFLAEFAIEGLTDEELPDYFRLADALFLPSREEGFGTPILEAGLAGLPVFCSELPALRALAGGCATYFELDADPRAVGRQIARRLQGNSIYQLRVSVRQSYTADALYQRWLAPLLEL